MSPTGAVLLCIGIAVFVEMWRAVAVARARRAGFREAQAEEREREATRKGTPP